MIRALLRTLGIVESDRAARGSAVGRMRAWVFGVVCLAAFAGQAYALFVREVGSPLEVSGTNVTVIEAFGTGAAISQTFVPRVPELVGLSLWFYAAERQTGVVRCELAVEAGQGFKPLYRWVETVDFDGPTRHTFTFPPVVPESARRLRFEVTLTTPADGVLGVEAAVADTIRPGFLQVDGQEQWGDLRFRTRTVSRFRVFEAAAQDLPRPFLEPSVMFVLLAIYNWAAMTFIYYMVVAGAEEW